MAMPGCRAHALSRRYGRSADRPEHYEKHVVTGRLAYVYATGGDITIEGDDGKTWKVRLIAADYSAAGSTYQAYKAALRVQKQIGRRVTAELQYHPAFGWTIFGGSKIRLAKGGGR